MQCIASRVILLRTISPILFFLLVGGDVSAQSQTTEVTLWMPEITARFPNTRDYAVSPDGSEICFTVESVQKEFSTIVMMRRSEGRWMSPQVLLFSGQYRDIEPAFSHDGKRLYFASNRPLADGADEPKDYDIWYAERARSDDEWSYPVNLGPPVNTPKDEFYPSITMRGDLYLTREADDPARREDIFVSRRERDVFRSPEPLSNAVNSSRYEFNAFIAPDESYIIFTSYARPDDLGGGDLYISYRENDEWTQAQHLGQGINSNRIDYCPFVDTQQNILYFTSERSSVPKWFGSPQSLSSLEEVFRNGSVGKGQIYSVPLSKVLKR